MATGTRLTTKSCVNFVSNTTLIYFTSKKKRYNGVAFSPGDPEIYVIRGLINAALRRSYWVLQPPDPATASSNTVRLTVTAICHCETLLPKLH